ncbi:MAG: hypothetical protein ABSE73_06615 [Planctomycetota bacterium]
MKGVSWKARIAQLRHKLPPECRHPLAAVHPRALRACAFCRKLGWGSLWGAPLAALCRVFAQLLAVSDCRKVAEVLSGASKVFACGTFFGVVICMFVRWLIVAFFFTRYSLTQLMLVVLSIGACGTGIAALPDLWKILPIIGLVCLVYVIFTFVTIQDPEGVKYTPAFLRRALAKKKTQAGSGNTESGR